MLNVLFLFLMLGEANSARILGVLPENVASHQIIGTTLLFALAEQGHEITILTPMIPKKRNDNVTILQVNLEGFVTNSIDLYNIGDPGIFVSISAINLLNAYWSENFLKDANVKKLISSNAQFDLVLIDVLGNHAHKGFCYHFNAICATLNIFGSNFWLDAQIGNPNNPSYVPDRDEQYTASMHFFERFYNTLAFLVKSLNFYFVSLPTQTRIMQKYFPGAPNLKHFFYNVSLSLVNSHFANSLVVPNLPNVVEIGGLHIGPPQQLPQDVQGFLDASENGFIYFCMGSILKSKNINKKNLEMLISVFSELKLNVLWKFEDESVKMPPNVKIVEWISQVDVLAHPNIRLFITHGGLLSVTEAIHFGVPIVGISVFADQTLNVKLAEESGFAIGFRYALLDEKNLKEAINLILTNLTFSEAAKRKSKIYHDQITKPLNRAVYWVEYCIRHKGAHHLRSPALNLYWYQYLLLDILGVVLGGTILALVTITIIFKKLFKNVCKKKVD